MLHPVVINRVYRLRVGASEHANPPVGQDSPCPYLGIWSRFMLLSQSADEGSGICHVGAMATPDACRMDGAVWGG